MPISRRTRTSASDSRSTTDGCRPSVTSSSSSTSGFAISARHDQHLLLAAGQRAGPLAQPLGQHRRPAADLLETRAHVTVREHAKSEIVADRQVLEQRMFLGNIDQPHLPLQMRRYSRHVLACKFHSAAPGRQEADDGLEPRGLAHAVLADDGEGFGFAERKTDVADHLRRAVAACALVDVQNSARLLIFRSDLFVAQALEIGVVAGAADKFGILEHVFAGNIASWRGPKSNSNVDHLATRRQTVRRGGRNGPTHGPGPIGKPDA